MVLVLVGGIKYTASDYEESMEMVGEMSIEEKCTTNTSYFKGEVGAPNGWSEDVQKNCVAYYLSLQNKQNK